MSSRPMAYHWLPCYPMGKHSQSIFTFIVGRPRPRTAYPGEDKTQLRRSSSPRRSSHRIGHAGKALCRRDHSHGPPRKVAPPRGQRVGHVSKVVAPLTPVLLAEQSQVITPGVPDACNAALVCGRPHQQPRDRGRERIGCVGRGTG